MSEDQPIVERDRAPDDWNQPGITRSHFFHELFGCGRVLRILPEYRAMNVIAQVDPHESGHAIRHRSDVSLLRRDCQAKMTKLISNGKAETQGRRDDQGKGPGER